MMSSNSVRNEISSVRPEPVEGHANAIQLVGCQIEILDDCIQHLNEIDMEGWRLAVALYASQAICFAKACLALWKSEESLTLACAPLFRSFLEAYVNFLYLQKCTDAGFRDLMLSALHDELKAMADGELLNVLSSDEKNKRLLEIKSLINENEELGAKNLSLEARMFKIWGSTNKRVYEYYRTLSAVSHSRLTWFSRTFGSAEGMALTPNNDGDEDYGQVVLMAKALENMSLGLAVIEPQLATT
jgi:hypothetical protein